MSADGSLHFRHEPIARDSAAFTRGEVAEHLHPCARVRRRSGVAAAMFCQDGLAIDTAGIWRFDRQSQCSGSSI